MPNVVRVSVTSLGTFAHFAQVWLEFFNIDFQFEID